MDALVLMKMKTINHYQALEAIDKLDQEVHLC